MSKSKNRVTIKDLATACDVSTATISRVLNHIEGGYSAETEARIRQAVEEMGYTPNRMAQSLVTRKTGLIGLLVPDIHYYFFQEFYAGLEDYFNQCGYRILLCNTQEDLEKEKLFITELSNGLVDGIIVSTLNCVEDNEHIVKLEKEGFPMILLERYGKGISEIVNLRVDNKITGMQAVEYLAQRGHKRIAFMQGPQEAYNAELRYQGYLEGLKEQGIPFDASLVRRGNYRFDASVKATEELIKTEEFTAIIGANDLMTLGICKAIIKNGKNIPEDISVFGLDGTLLTDTHQPTLTTLDFHAADLGQCAGESMKALIEGKRLNQRLVNFVPELHNGKSVKSHK